MDTIWLPSIEKFEGPKYKALASSIRAAIQGDVLKPRQKLPPVRDLAWDLKITPGTVARAYTLLTDEGTLEAAVGRGTFVAAKKLAPVNEPASDYLSDVVIKPISLETRPEVVRLTSPLLPDVGQVNLIQTLMARVAANPQSGVMHYPNRKTFKPARCAVLHWLEGTPLGAIDQEDIVLSHGGQNGVSLALQSILSGPSPVILVEELSYPGFRRAAALLRAEVIAIPMDENGMIPEAIAAIAKFHNVQAICTSPEVHNPTGLFTPLERREDIVEVARAHDIQIIEDDCYRMGPTRAPGYRMLAPERGWYVSSISKTLTPALRIGFVVAPKPNVPALRRSAEHGFFGLATPLADLAELLLTDPRAVTCAEQVNAVFAKYVQTCVNHLGTYDLTWNEDVPFVWLKLPEGWRASAFCQAAEVAKVQIRPAEEFAGREARAPHAVRIAINAQIDHDHFEAAMVRLRNLLDNPPERIGV
ncbi:MAG: PLP-dependent aminotransferase family protein [Planktotalea sp.]|uniref:aminotransferase-like domain-containing protein n=1 Tax=Planktotalea sp. TaxID=2029877 RepID=UPI003C782911